MVFQKGNKFSEEIEKKRIESLRYSIKTNGFSDEHKRRISEWHKGKPLSEETKAKMKGRKGWNKGLTKDTNSIVKLAAEKLSASLIKNGSRKLEKNSKWKWGIKMAKGYIFLKVPNHPRSKPGGYIAEHTLVMEKVVSRYLTKEEVVHHIDFNRRNNTPENLFLCVRKKHNELHKNLNHYLKKLLDKGYIRWNQDHYEVSE